MNSDWDSEKFHGARDLYVMFYTFLAWFMVGLQRIHVE